MKTAYKIMLLLSCIAATLSFAQTYSTPIKNVIVVIQENRAPDNLFQDPTLVQAGADIISPTDPSINCQGNQLALQAVPLQTCTDPNHGHGGWINQYAKGAMNGACTNGNVSANCPNGTPPYPCPWDNTRDCSEYTYVPGPPQGDNTIKPYWDIAERYGFANYFFQTSQGPSFPAHQFIFGGSSAPSSIQNPFYAYFASGNTTTTGQDAGCGASSSSYVELIDPQGKESREQHPCFDRPTLATLLDNAGIPWRYYSDQANSIWTAPNAINNLCLASGQGYGTPCGSPEWNSNVAQNLEGSQRIINGQSQATLAPFLYDLQNCNFPNSGGVYFVVPDGRWSDHPIQNIGMGPDWVANIVNLVGRTAAQQGCAGPMPNWNNTAVLIVWDDWGGWYDHISPKPSIGNGQLGYPNGTGAQYVFGFRVPFLVVSAYVKETNGNPGYISGTKQNPIYYDFGSILQFIKNTYSITQDIDPPYEYADYFAGQRQPFADLRDFFLFCDTCARPFIPINLVDNPKYCNNQQGGCGQTSCNVACFINYPGKPADPDTD